MSDNDKRGSDRTGGDAASAAVTRTADQGSSTIGRLVLLGLAVGAAVVLVKQMPDLKRYLKMKQM